MPKKRCLFCRQWFELYLPMAKLQRVCGASKCRRRFKRMLERARHRRHPQRRKKRRARRRKAWRVYMHRYRASRPEYRAREVARIQRRRASVRKTGLVTGLSVEEKQKMIVRPAFIDAGHRLQDNGGA